MAERTNRGERVAAGSVAMWLLGRWPVGLPMWGCRLKVITMKATQEHPRVGDAGYIGRNGDGPGDLRHHQYSATALGCRAGYRG
jgi:hypothetical protein